MANTDKEEKVTTMVLNVVDLQCSKCYKKVKKLLCKFSQIRDQTYDEKANKVTIKVVCCSPERMRDKLCCKGRGSIKSIEIKEPKEEKKTNPDDSEKKEKGAKESKEHKDEAERQLMIIELDLQLEGKPMKPPQGFCCGECYSGRPGGPCSRGGRVPCDGYYYGRPVCDCWGGCRYGRAYYCTEEIQQGCTIM